MNERSAQVDWASMSKTGRWTQTEKWTIVAGEWDVSVDHYPTRAGRVDERGGGF